MRKYPKVTIIIPLYIFEERFFIDLKKFKKLRYPDYEILVVSDKKVDIGDLRIRSVLTGKSHTGPAEKRDIGIKESRGKICAFIDDDAYPGPLWLKNAVRHFAQPQIAAVGGPGLTPREDNYWQQITGLIYGSFFCGGFAQYRFVKGKLGFVQDYPAYNLLVRKDVLKEVGGYRTHYYGGEDTFLCLKLIKKGYKIIYDPDVVVFHHRRPLFRPYLKQIANIGLHRGYFAKKFPETSMKMFYFLPSMATIIFFFLIVGALFSLRLFIYLAISIFVSMIVLIASVIRKTDLFSSLVVSIGIVLTHITYGLSFIKGLLTNELKR